MQSDCQDTPHPSRVSLEAGQIDRMATRHVERVVVVGANARTYEQRMDRRMRRTKIRQGDALEVPSERRITIRTTTALTNTSLRDFVFVVAAGAVVVGTKLQTAPRPLALGLNACSPSSLGRGALPVVGRHAPILRLLGEPGSPRIGLTGALYCRISSMAAFRA